MSLKTILLLVAVLLVVAGGVVYYLAGQEPGPLVTPHGPAALGSGATQLDVSVETMGTKLTGLTVRLEQGNQQFPVFALDAPGDAKFAQETPDRMRLTKPIPAKSFSGLKDGPARFVITAERQVLLGLRRAVSTTVHEIKVRLTPPTLSVVSTHHYIKLGGAEMIVYRVAPPDAASGVAVGDRFYPGFPTSGIKGAKTTDPTLRVAFFALMFDQDTSTPMKLVAHDSAGNSASAEFDHKTFTDRFHRSRVPVDDAFLSRVVPAILQATPDLKLAAGTPEERVQAFLAINGDLRRKNAAFIEATARDTAADMLWKGPFRRMARAASAAVFADHRTYVSGNREIDQQVHLGVDLASTKGAAVAAANSGRVAFAGPLGIYGNCVIIDHGMGIGSLYAHLSKMDVEKGDTVQAGEAIGNSGMTGLAAGDHLHFTTLVDGRPVNPVEWWDPHWIMDRIDRKLFEAGITADAPKLGEAKDGTKPTTARTKARAAAKPKTPAKSKKH